MIEQADALPERKRKMVTEDTILHRAIVNPDVQRIQDQLKAKDKARKVAIDGKLHKPSGDRKRT